MLGNTKVAIHGSYFADNYGDTLLVKLMCDMAASVVGQDNVYLAVAGHAREQRSIGYPVIPVKDRATVTHLIYGGGGYLGERTGKGLENMSWSFRNYRRHLSWRGDFSNAKSAVIGAGFGPISNRLLRRKVRDLLVDAEVVLLRDQESLSFAEEYGIRHPSMGMCVDVALSLPLSQRSRSGVALHTDNLDAQELETIFEGVASAYGRDVLIEIIFDNPPSYSEEAVRKYEAAAQNFDFHGLKFRPYDRFDVMVDRVSQYSLIITSKLHVGITCIAQGGRAISVPTHQKTVRLYRQLGIPQFCIPRADLTTDRLTATIADAGAFNPNRSVIDEGIAKVREAVRNFIR